MTLNLKALICFMEWNIGAGIDLDWSVFASARRRPLPRFN